MDLRELGKRRARQATALLAAAGLLGAAAASVAVWSAGTSTGPTGPTTSTSDSGPDDQFGGSSTGSGSSNPLLPGGGSPSVAHSGGS